MAQNIQQTAKGALRIIDDSAGTLTAGGVTVTKPITGLSLDPGNRALTSVVNSLARTDTTTKVLGVIPAGAIPAAISLASATASNAGTTGTLSVGSAATSTYFLSGFDVKGSTGSQQVYPTSAVKLNTVLDASNDTVIVGVYAETGTTSSAGGPWQVRIDYYMP